MCLVFRGPLFWTLTALALGTGCAGGLRSGRFDARGFTHEHLEYRVRAHADGTVAGPGWALENYQLDDAGNPTVSKTGPEYVRTPRLDLDGDGRPDELRPTPVDDLRFVSRRDAGVMWVRTLLLPHGRADTELRVLMRLYVDSINGSGLRSTELRSGETIAIERRFATRDLDAAALTVDGRDAFAATIDVANVDQLQLDPERRWERARIVMIRTGLGWSTTTGRRTPLLPTVMVVGYSNLPEDYERSLPDFERLLERIELVTEATSALYERAQSCVSGGAALPLVVHTFGGVDAGRNAEAQECLNRELHGFTWPAVWGWRSFAVQRPVPDREPAITSPPAPTPQAAVE